MFYKLKKNSRLLSNLHLNLECLLCGFLDLRILTEQHDSLCTKDVIIMMTDLLKQMLNKVLEMSKFTIELFSSFSSSSSY